MKQVSLVMMCIALSVLTTSGQTPPEAPSFEVASVKPAGPPERGLQGLPQSVVELIGFHGGPGTSDPGRIRYSGVTLKMLLKRAFNMKSEQISGPAWLDEETYEIVANVPPGTSAERLRLMLQGLLTDRFHIRMHRVARTLPVYRLTVAKNGPKLKPAEAVPEYRTDPEGIAAIQAKHAAEIKAMRDASMRRREQGGAPRRSFQLPRATVTRFVEMLSSYLDRPVRDATHLEGLYAFALSWVPDTVAPAASEGAGAVTDAPTGPSIFSAIQEQLGLRLQPENEQFEVLVIDTAQKAPTSN